MGPEGAPDPPGRRPELRDPPVNVEEARVQYYDAKFGVDVQTHEGAQGLRHLFQSYLEGLQWVLLYYYRGPNCASWSWYYPYYHAPMAVDFVEYDQLRTPCTHFDVGEAFLPFQQLMAVLPSNSKGFLPRCFQRLFDAPDSPIVDFYPPKFDIDMDGVKVAWGGVTLIPFIDQQRLLDAMAQAEQRGPPLTIAEQARNRVGEAFSFRYDAGFSIEVKSPMPQRFHSLVNSPVRSSVFKHPPLPMGMAHFINDVLPGFKLQTQYFPSLYTHPITHNWGEGVQVFQFQAKGKSLIVHPCLRGPTFHSEEDIRQVLHAPLVRVGYPFMRLGKVVTVFASESVFNSDGNVSPNNAQEHLYYVTQQLQDWRRRGVAFEFDAGGGDAGRARRGGRHGGAAEEVWPVALADVRVVEGSQTDAAGRRHYKFADTPSYHLLHLVSIEADPPTSAASAPAQQPPGHRSSTQHLKNKINAQLRQSPAPGDVQSDRGAALGTVAVERAAASSAGAEPAGAAAPGAQAGTEKDRRASGSKVPQSYYTPAAGGPAPQGRDHAAATPPGTAASANGGGASAGAAAGAEPGRAASSGAGAWSSGAAGGGGGAQKKKDGGGRNAACPAPQLRGEGRPSASGGAASGGGVEEVGRVDWSKMFDELLALGPRGQGQ